MQVLAARPAAFNKPAPLQEFSLGAGRAAIFARAADVAPDGFAHPVFRAGFALAIPLPEVH